jgi:hypothetical protein
LVHNLFRAQKTFPATYPTGRPVADGHFDRAPATRPAHGFVAISQRDSRFEKKSPHSVYKVGWIC